MVLKTITSNFIRVLSLSLCISLIIATTGIAANYYVDKNHSSASDSNSGSESSPWKTIQTGANVAVAGDTIFVKDGIYNEWVNIKKSGTSDTERITFMAYPGHKPIIDGTGVSVPGWYGLIHSGDYNGNSTKYITVDGFEIRNSPQCGVRIIKGQHWILKNNLIHDMYRGTVYFHQVNNVLIKNNEVYGSSWNGINVQGGNNVIMEYNYIHDNPHHFGLQIITDHPEGDVSFYRDNIIRYNKVTRNQSGMYFRNNINLNIHDNLIYKNQGYAGIWLGEDDGTSGSFDSHSKIHNNTFVNNPRSIYDKAFNYIEVKNNIFYFPTYEVFKFMSDAVTGHNIDFNLYYGKDYSGKGSNSLYADPLFVNTESNDFNLKSDSPAVGRGENGSDIGARLGPVSALSPPKSLRIITN